MIRKRNRMSRISKVNDEDLKYFFLFKKQITDISLGELNQSNSCQPEHWTSRRI